MFKNGSWIDNTIILIIAICMVLLAFRSCAEGIEIENTLWQYQLDKPFQVTEYYGFANDNVYWVDGDTAYEFPTKLNIWAFYDTVKNIAVMYNYYLGSQGLIISYFDKNKAVQIGITNLLTSYTWEYKLTLIGDLF